MKAFMGKLALATAFAMRAYSQDPASGTEPLKRVTTVVSKDEEAVLRKVVGSDAYDKLTPGALRRIVTALKEARIQAEAGNLDPRKTDDLIRGKVSAAIYDFSADLKAEDIVGPRLAQKLNDAQAADIIRKYKDLVSIFLSGGAPPEVAEKRARTSAVAMAKNVTTQRRIK